MSCLNIQTWIQARKSCRTRLKTAGRHPTCSIGLAERYNISLPTRRWYRACKIPYRDIHTLDPAKFLNLRQDWIDVSFVSHPTLHIFSSSTQEGSSIFKPVQLPYAMKPLDTDSSDRRGLRDDWPGSSQGFLYYSCPPGRPRIAGELRLRLTPTNDPSTFQQGKDLCLVKPTPSGAVGQPWKRPLYSVATNLNSRPLYEKLIEEGLVSPELDKSIQSLPKLTFMYSRCQIIHSLYDTFAFDLSSDWITLVAVAETGIATMHILRQFSDLRIHKSPYSGTVLARFEPSTLPQHENTRTVVLRVLQELTPVRCLIKSYDGYIERPRPDHLFAKRFHGKLRPWSVDIDSPDKAKLTVAGLKLIWGSTHGLR